MCVPPRVQNTKRKGKIRADNESLRDTYCPTLVPNFGGYRIPPALICAFVILRKSKRQNTTSRHILVGASAPYAPI